MIDFTINKEGDGFTVVFPNGTLRQATIIETALCQRIDVISQRLANAEALYGALEAFVNNSSVQANHPDECEKAEAILAESRGES